MNNLFDLLKNQDLNDELAKVLQESDDSVDCVSLLTTFAGEHGVTISDDEVKEFMSKIPLPESFMDEVAGGAKDILTSDFAGNSSKWKKLMLVAIRNPQIVIDPTDCEDLNPWDPNSPMF